jgi:Rad3-related DNA helicase
MCDDMFSSEDDGLTPMDMITTAETISIGPNRFIFPDGMKVTPAQQHMMDGISSFIKGDKKVLFLTSPTGSGKSVGILSSILSGPECSVTISSRTHQQLSQIASTLNMFRSGRSMTHRCASHRLCAREDVRQKGRMGFNRRCKDIVSRGECDHYANSMKMAFYDIIFSVDRTSWDIEDLIQVCKIHDVCPKEVVHELGKGEPIILCPYNFILSGEGICVIDEGHNIEQLCCDLSRFSVTADTFHVAMDYISHHPEEERKEIMGHLSRVYMTFNRMVGILTQYPPFSLMHKDLVNEMDGLAESIRVLSGLPYDNGMINKHMMSSLVYGLSHLLPILEGPPYFAWTIEGCDRRLEGVYVTVDWLFSPLDHESREQQMMCDRLGRSSLVCECFSPRPTFRKIIERYDKIIIASATLLPADMLADMLGLSEWTSIDCSHLHRPNVLLTSMRQVYYEKGFVELTSQWELTHHEGVMYKMMCVLAHLISSTEGVVDGGITVFFPSSRFIKGFTNAIGYPKDTRLRRDVLVEPSDEAISMIRSTKLGCKNLLILSVVRGRLSEGTDMPGECIRWLIIFGVPYPQDNKMMRWRREYHNAHNKSLNGDLWYEMTTFSAVKQTMGRVSRSRSDYGVVTLMDSRYNRDILARNGINGVEESASVQALRMKMEGFFKNKV